jgi:acetylornithine deacetylase/succinyl-diaminopimelate desuccinylase-like protein
MNVHEYLEVHRERILQELIEFVRIPSVSTDPAYQSGIQSAVEWIVKQFKSIGEFDVQVLQTQKHPVVHARWNGAPDKPTLLIYGHYDVQPPDPLDKWRTAPFEPEVRDGRLYGRGVSDDKGPMFIPIKVAEAFFATTGTLPVNISFMIEGGEEIGSPGLETLLRQYPDLFKADFVLSADGAMWRIDEPSITTASRGLVGLEFTLTGTIKDLHSGRYGGAVANPLHAMAQLVATLHDPDGRVAIEGFYEYVTDISSEARTAIQKLPFDEQNFLNSIDAPDLFGEPGYTTLERLWIRPTLEVNGLWGGYQGPGSKTVIPNEAHAKLTSRLVPHQQPDDIQAKIILHLERHCPPGVRLSIQSGSHGALPYEIPGDHIGLKIAAEVLEQVYHKPAVYVRMGGTLPVSELFKRILNQDTIFFSFSTADEDFHAPNEFFRLNRLYEGLNAWAMYWEKLTQVTLYL